jgi:hypothetical protein
MKSKWLIIPCLVSLLCLFHKDVIHTVYPQYPNKNIPAVYVFVKSKNADKRSLYVTSTDESVRCIIEHCNSYVYLGSIFTSDGSIKNSVKLHAEDKRKHLLKLVTFLSKNCDMPFHLKYKVFNACFFTSIIYGCESWLYVNSREIESLFMSAVRALLGVRVSTC